MSQKLEYQDYPAPSKPSESGQVHISGTAGLIIEIIQTTSLFFKSIQELNELHTHDGTNPISIENDTIRIKEKYFEENKPYAISYKGKDYIVRRTDGKIKIFEIVD